MALICAAVILIAGLYVGALIVTTPARGDETQPDAAPVRPLTCSHVRASKWNHLIRVERTLDGHSAHRLRNKPICVKDYKAFKRHVKQVRADCIHRHVKWSGASYYSYGDSGGIVGACGTHLLDASARYSFAILGTGNVRSRCGQHFFFKRNGVVRRGVQADTGGGGGSAGGYPRTFDFWNPPSGGGLARDLGLISAGLAAVQYSPVNCWIH